MVRSRLKKALVVVNEPSAAANFLEVLAVSREEFLQDWYQAGTARVASDTFRRQLFTVAGELGIRDIKIAPGFHEATADIP